MSLIPFGSQPFDRSHDGFTTLADGTMEPAGGSPYASQRVVFNDLGQGVLDNAFQGLKPCITHMNVRLSMHIKGFLRR